MSRKTRSGQTAHQNKKLTGDRKGRPKELPLDKMLDDCMYTPGYRDPNTCFDDNGKVIYERGWDKRILDNLHRKHKLKQKALELWNNLKVGAIRSKVKLWASSPL